MHMDHIPGMLQWPAMAVSVAGAWWVGDVDRHHRHYGFVALLVSNALWIVWGFSDSAWALVTLQAIFIILNGRGLRHTETGTAPQATH